eukprot:TRINITY_DN757_c0_g1_i1.p1 TRINITY_DN757_c0_g1~~TRINITY_DN757_c0_g1_i1.p1  ORF type:complete len:403 (+),score=63.24 TRINITY_DN757_c0_g1_i1:257-1465(+)
MLHYIQSREVGDHHPKLLSSIEILRRTYSLVLSAKRQVVAPHKAPITCIDIDKTDARYLLSGSTNSSVALYDVQEKINTDQHTFNPLFTITKSTHKDAHKFSVSALQWYPHDTGMFLTGGFDHFVKVWDTNQLLVACEFDLEDKVYCLAMNSKSAHHSLVATGTGDQKVRLCDLLSGKASHTLIGHREAIWAVEWSPSSDFLLVTGSVDRSIRLWDIRKASGCLHSFNQHNEQHVDNTPLANVVSVVSTAHNAPVTSLLFTPNGKFLISSANDNRIHLWDMATGNNTLVNYPNALNLNQRGFKMCLSANARFLYHPNNHSINVYDVLTGELVNELTGHFEKVSSVAFHPVRQELYSASIDQQILVWTPRMDEIAIVDEEGVQSKQQPTGLIEDRDMWSDEES